MTIDAATLSSATKSPWRVSAAVSVAPLSALCLLFLIVGSSLWDTALMLVFISSKAPLGHWDEIKALLLCGGLRVLDGRIWSWGF